MARREALILGIETSCDETAAAVVRFADGEPGGGRVVSNVIASQDDLHAEYRGVVPEIASRAHAERILPVVRRAVSEAGVSLRDVSAVAVGHRPGLIGSLLVGVAAAKALAWALGDGEGGNGGVPLVAVDHVHAHLYSGCLDGEVPRFPALGLVVSGGHTSLYRLESWTRLERLGATIDDAVGEAFDKAATVLGLPFPGGPELDRLASVAGADDRAVKFPVSRLSADSLDFSFSGLKTAMLYAARGVPGDRGKAAEPVPALDAKRKADLAASFRRAAVEAVMLKLERALESIGAGGGVVLCGGGVTRNSLLRTALAAWGARRGVEVRLPRADLCVDNGAMIAGLGYWLLEGRGWASDELSLAAVPTTAC